MRAEARLDASRLIYFKTWIALGYLLSHDMLVPVHGSACAVPSQVGTRYISGNKPSHSLANFHIQNICVMSDNLVHLQIVFTMQSVCETVILKVYHLWY